MIESLLTEVWSVAVGDADLIAIWSCPGQPPAQPRFYLDMAPDDTPMPYVVYYLMDGAAPGLESSWPMGDHRLEFHAYDYGNDKSRLMSILDRVIELFSHRGYAGDPNRVNCVRTYEAVGPHKLDSGAKLVTAYSVHFALRALNVGALNAKTVGPR